MRRQPSRRVDCDHPEPPLGTAECANSIIPRWRGERVKWTEADVPSLRSAAPAQKRKPRVSCERFAPTEFCLISRTISTKALVAGEVVRNAPYNERSPEVPPLAL